MFSKVNPGKEVKRKDNKLKSNILYDEKEGIVIKLKYFYLDGQRNFMKRKTYRY